MNTLTEAIHEYVGMRQSLGFKLLQVRGLAEGLCHLHGHQRENMGDQRIGLKMGHTAHWRTARPLGQTAHRSAGLRALSKCDGCADRDSRTGASCESPKAGQTVPLFRKRDLEFTRSGLHA